MSQANQLNPGSEEAGIQDPRWSDLISGWRWRAIECLGHQSSLGSEKLYYNIRLLGKYQEEAFQAEHERLNKADTLATHDVHA